MAIVLSKSGDKHTIDLTKRPKAVGEIKITLDWSKGGGGGFFQKLLGRGGDIDLDLGCFFELRDGLTDVFNSPKNLIDGLQFAHGKGGPRDKQTRQGCLTMPPYIWHKGDDRGTSGESGETILVNPNEATKIKRIIVYTFIFDGAARWAETNAVVKVSVPGCDDVIVEMGQQQDKRRFCAIAAIDISPSGSMTVQKLVTFHNGHSECDREYGWGFNYKPGSKD